MEEALEQYVVLARKYRPQNFGDLLGQDALVQTLTNAIGSNRIHHAYVLTGIRGVGKTTTARIIAKALNCIGPDGKGAPTAHPCGICENCKSIAAGRNIDVLELDAASRTGVEDVREILDGVRYKPTNCRYKVYIIDEVHMLSKNAFNALLKTLEEPPAHVKFIFATTEIRKVPVTVLSRCQRFDLQRLSIEDLLKLFNKIVISEKLKADDEALHLIACAAEGSARDGLSILDQAISLGNSKIRVDVVKNMLGLADRGQAFELFDLMLIGDMPLLLSKLQDAYKNGANPTAIIHDLIDITHALTKSLLVASYSDDISLPENEKNFIKQTASKVSVAVLSRIWQMLIKGLSEVHGAPVPIDALEMVLIRIAFSANLPSPAELLESVKKKSEISFVEESAKPATERLSIRAVCSPKRVDTSAAVVSFGTVEDFIDYLEKQKQARLVYVIKNDIEICEFATGVIRFKASERLGNDFTATVNRFLEEATGSKWLLENVAGEPSLTIAQKENEQKEADRQNIAETPLVKAILTEFSTAKIETLTRKAKDEGVTEEFFDIFFEE